MTPEQRFERELEIFQSEAESATQFYFAFLAVHAVAYKDKGVHALLNRTALFWNTCLGALQTSAFIALGRVFDTDSRHNISQLLRLAQDHREIFTKEALAQRKQGNKPERPDWLDEYMRTAYEPPNKDFRRLRAQVKKRRAIYNSNYRDVRHKWFAHKEIADPAEVSVLFGKGSNRELQQLLTFLGVLYEALWQMYVNGRKPVLRPARYSVKQMLHKPSPPFTGGAVQEKITREAAKFLKAASAQR